MTKEDWKLIWALVKSSEAVGYHGARLDSEETTEAFTDAFQDRHEAIAKLVRRLAND